MYQAISKCACDFSSPEEICAMGPSVSFAVVKEENFRYGTEPVVPREEATQNPVIVWGAFLDVKT